MVHLTEIIQAAIFALAGIVAVSIVAWIITRKNNKKNGR